MSSQIYIQLLLILFRVVGSADPRASALNGDNFPSWKFPKASPLWTHLCGILLRDTSAYRLTSYLCVACSHDNSTCQSKPSHSGFIYCLHWLWPKTQNILISFFIERETIKVQNECSTDIRIVYSSRRRKKVSDCVLSQIYPNNSFNCKRRNLTSKSVCVVNNEFLFDFSKSHNSIITELWRSWILKWPMRLCLPWTKKITHWATWSASE